MWIEHVNIPLNNKDETKVWASAASPSIRHFAFILEPSTSVILWYDHATKIAYAEANWKVYLLLLIYIFQCLIKNLWFSVCQCVGLSTMHLKLHYSCGLGIIFSNTVAPKKPQCHSLPLSPPTESTKGIDHELRKNSRI